MSDKFLKGYEKLTSPIIGMPCCRVAVGEHKSFSVGFGASVKNTGKLPGPRFYGEYEMGTYSAFWRIEKQKETIFCKSDDFGQLDVRDSLSNMLSGLTFSHLEVEARAKLILYLSGDRRLIFDGTSCDREDEIFHIFLPNSEYLEYSWERGWRVGPAKGPWRGGMAV
jgi:hypothetical protein